MNMYDPNQMMPPQQDPMGGGIAQAGPPQGPPMQGPTPQGPPMQGPTPQGPPVAAPPITPNVNDMWVEMTTKWSVPELQEAKANPEVAKGRGIHVPLLIDAALTQVLGGIKKWEDRQAEYAASQTPPTTVTEDIDAELAQRAGGEAGPPPGISHAVHPVDGGPAGPPPPMPGLGEPLPEGMGVAGAMPPEMVPPGSPGYPFEGQEIPFDPNAPQPDMSYHFSNGAYPVKRFAGGGLAETEEERMERMRVENPTAWSHQTAREMEAQSMAAIGSATGGFLRDYAVEEAGKIGDSYRDHGKVLGLPMYAIDELKRLKGAAGGLTNKVIRNPEDLNLQDAGIAAELLLSAAPGGVAVSKAAGRAASKVAGRTAKAVQDISPGLRQMGIDDLPFHERNMRILENTGLEDAYWPPERHGMTQWGDVPEITDELLEMADPETGALLRESMRIPRERPGERLGDGWDEAALGRRANNALAARMRARYHPLRERLELEEAAREEARRAYDANPTPENWQASFDADYEAASTREMMTRPISFRREVEDFVDGMNDSLSSQGLSGEDLLPYPPQGPPSGRRLGDPVRPQSLEMRENEYRIVSDYIDDILEQQDHILDSNHTAYLRHIRERERVPIGSRGSRESAPLSRGGARDRLEEAFRREQDTGRRHEQNPTSENWQAHIEARRETNEARDILERIESQERAGASSAEFDLPLQHLTTESGMPIYNPDAAQRGDYDPLGRLGRPEPIERSAPDPTRSEGIADVDAATEAIRRGEDADEIIEGDFEEVLRRLRNINEDPGFSGGAFPVRGFKDTTLVTNQYRTPSLLDLIVKAKASGMTRDQVTSRFAPGAGPEFTSVVDEVYGTPAGTAEPIVPPIAPVGPTAPVAQELPSAVESPMGLSPTGAERPTGFDQYGAVVGEAVAPPEHARMQQEWENRVVPDSPIWASGVSKPAKTSLSGQGMTVDNIDAIRSDASKALGTTTPGANQGYRDRMSSLYERLAEIQKTPSSDYKAEALLTMAGAMLNPENATGNWFGDLASGFGAGVAKAAPLMSQAQERSRSQQERALGLEIDALKMEHETDLSDRRLRKEAESRIALQKLVGLQKEKEIELSAENELFLAQTRLSHESTQNMLNRLNEKEIVNLTNDVQKSIADARNATSLSQAGIQLQGVREQIGGHWERAKLAAGNNKAIEQMRIDAEDKWRSEERSESVIAQMSQSASEFTIAMIAESEVSGDLSDINSQLTEAKSSGIIFGPDDDKVDALLKKRSEIIERMEEESIEIVERLRSAAEKSPVVPPVMPRGK